MIVLVDHLFLLDLEHIQGLGCRAVLISATTIIDQKASCVFFLFDKEGLVLYRGFRSVTAVIKAAGSSACFHYNQTGQRTNRTTKILRKELKRMTGNKIMSRWTAMARHHALPSRIILSQPPLSTAFCEEL